MEEKESTTSASPLNSDSDSPLVSGASPPVSEASQQVSGALPPVMNMSTGISLTGGSGGLDSLGRKKRGRPRKYDADGNLRLPVTPPPGFTLTPSSDFSSKRGRGRGRPPVSGNWQLLASLGEVFASTAGGDFTPHVVTVNTGEDVASKIFSFSQKGPRGVCILAANGAVSNVILRQPGSSGGILTYEGRFEILSLSGSFSVTEIGGIRSRTGGLSVSLAGPDGRVIGGGIAGLLTAASPIQLVVGSFTPNSFYKALKRKQYYEPRMGALTPDRVTVTAATPISQATPNTGPESHAVERNARTGDPIINANHIPFQNTGWTGTEPTSNHSPSPDINVSLASE